MNAMMTITTMGNTILIMMSVREIDMLTITRRNVKEFQEPCDVAGEVSLNELGLTRCAPVNDVNHLLVAIAELTRR